MNIRAAQNAQSTIVTIEGSIDSLTADQVTSFLTKHIGNQEINLVVDLAHVDFMSSAGLRAILIALKDNRQHGGDLRLAAAQPGVGKALNMSGFTNILKTFDTVDEAVNSFS